MTWTRSGICCRASRINMGSISNLPSPGQDFKASSGAGNFAQRFSYASSRGSLKSLGASRQQVIDEVKKYESQIQAGKFSHGLRQRAWNNIRSAGRLDKAGEEALKELFDHLGQAAPKRKIVQPRSLRLSRDPENKFDFAGLRQAAHLQRSHRQSSIAAVLPKPEAKLKETPPPPPPARPPVEMDI